MITKVKADAKTHKPAGRIGIVMLSILTPYLVS